MPFVRPWALFGATAILAGSLSAAPASAATTCSNVTPAIDEVVTCTGAGAASVAVPTGAATAQVIVIGAGGGGFKGDLDGTSTTAVASSGGSGARVTATLSLTGTTTLEVTVGAGGAAGGAAGTQQVGVAGTTGGGGGGFSAIYDNSVSTTTALVVAGGGGGGGASRSFDHAKGGSGAASFGVEGGSGSGSAGPDGTPSRGGTGGPNGLGGTRATSSVTFTGTGAVNPIFGQDGTDWTAGGAGGAGGNAGGTGGAGYGGGGGGLAAVQPLNGGALQAVGYGGAAGGSYVNPTKGASATYVPKSPTNGGTLAGTAGGDGEVQITFRSTPAPEPSSDGAGSGAAPASAPITTTITLDPNAGTCATTSVAGDQGSWVRLPGSGDCARSGYTFGGWQGQPGDALPSGVLPPGSAVALLSDNTLYATWRALPKFAPTAPTQVAVTFTGTKPSKITARVTWEPPTKAGSAPIDRYVVRLDTVAIPCEVGADQPRACTFPIPKEGMYGASVVAETSNGNSVPAVSEKAWVGRPSRPKVTVTEGDGMLTPAWTQDTADGLPVLAYSVEAPNGKVLCTAEGKTSCTIKGLDNGREYRLSVVATNALGRSAASRVTGTPGTVPGRPVRVEMDNSIQGKVDLFWQERDNGGHFVEYAQVKVGTSGAWVKVPVDAKDPAYFSYRVTGLKKGQTTTASIRFVNDLGAGPAAKVKIG